MSEEPSIDRALGSAEPPASERLEQLVRQYARLVRSVVRRVAGPAAAQLGEDIEQRVFLEIWKQLSREQKIEYPSSYVYRAAVRETVRTLKLERRYEPADDESSPQPAGPAHDPEERARLRETAEKVEQVIDSLTPERQKAVRADLAGLKVQELMALEGWTYQQARNLISRGRAQLRSELAKRGIHV